MGNINSKKRKREDMEGTSDVYQQVFEKNDILRHLAEYLDADALCHKTALLSKKFLAFAEVTAENRLTCLCEYHNVDDDFDQFIERELRANFQSHTNNGNRWWLFRRIPPRVWPARVKLSCAYTVPVKIKELSMTLGPLTILPQSGNVVLVAGDEDPKIVILDGRTMELRSVTPFGFTPIVGGGPINRIAGGASWTTSDLFCCNQQYLVLSRAGFQDRKWIHVWRVQETDGEETTVQFLRTIAGPEPVTGRPTVDLEEVVVAEDSILYLLWHYEQAGRNSYEIEAHDLPTGNIVATTTVEMPAIPPRTKSPNYFVTTLVLFANHIVLLRHYEQAGSFPDMGAGAYSFRRCDLEQVEYLSCFDQGEVHININRSKRSSRYVLFRDFSAESFHRMVGLDDSNGALTIGNYTNLGVRSDVILVTPRNLYSYYADEGLMQIDQYDLTARSKVRSLKTGIGRDNHQYLMVTAQANQKRRELVVPFVGYRLDPLFLVYMLETV